MANKITKNKALTLINETINDFEKLISSSTVDNMFDDLYEEKYLYTEGLIKQIFSEEEKNTFRDQLALAASLSDNPQEELKDYRDHLKSVISRLKAMRSTIENFWENDSKNSVKLTTELKSNINLLTSAYFHHIGFFSPISAYLTTLGGFDYSNLSKEDLFEITQNIKKIDDFFENYRNQPDDYYSGPNTKIIDNDISVKRMVEIVDELNEMSDEEFENEISQVKNQKSAKKRGIFIGHGRSKLWARVNIFLKEDLKLETFSFESEPHEGESIIPILEGFLDKASFAILILTAEDETSDNKFRARQNVIHEAGLFQGRLGFKKAILLVQDGIEEYSNIAGLQHIKFHGDEIEETFYKLERVLRRENMVT